MAKLKYSIFFNTKLHHKVELTWFDILNASKRCRYEGFSGEMLFYFLLIFILSLSLVFKFNALWHCKTNIKDAMHISWYHFKYLHTSQYITKLKYITNDTTNVMTNDGSRTKKGFSNYISKHNNAWLTILHTMWMSVHVKRKRKVIRHNKKTSML